MAVDPKIQEIVTQAETSGMLGTLDLEMSPELTRLLERGLLGEGLPAVMKTSRAAQAFQQAFELIGGVPRLALWADQNPSKFYTLFSKLVPSTAEVHEKKDIKVTIEWASPERLSYAERVDPT